MHSAGGLKMSIMSDLVYNGNNYLPVSFLLINVIIYIYYIRREIKRKNNVKQKKLNLALNGLLIFSSFFIMKNGSNISEAILIIYSVSLAFAYLVIGVSFGKISISNDTDPIVKKENDRGVISVNPELRDNGSKS
jgi:hypothetical protein